MNRHKSHKGLNILGESRVETVDQRCCFELSWTTTKVNVNINTTNESEGKGRDLNYRVFELAEVLARHIPITKFV